MTGNPKRLRFRRALPLVGTRDMGIYTKCEKACGSACHHDVPNTSRNETFEQVVRKVFTRRGFLKGGMTTAAVLSTPMSLAAVAAPAAAQEAPPQAAGRTGAGSDPRTLSHNAHPLTFSPIEPTEADDVVVPEGYATALLIRWGDPILSGAPEFDFNNQSAAAQEQQFGYNNDYVAYMPLDWGSDNSRRGLLVVNHEYTNAELMFPGFNPEDVSEEQAAIELAAHGLSILEVRRKDDSNAFEVVLDSGYNRRITALSTEHLLTGPAAGNDLLKTSADPSGTRVIGTLNNCAGGKTPWGTVLSGEENFDQYFGAANLLPETVEVTTDVGVEERPNLVRAAHTRYALATEATGQGGDDEVIVSQRQWERYYPRFNVAENPNEPFRFGWVVEVDPYDPDFVPKKRTAMGRLKHEGATIAIAKDHRVAAYMGDDQQFDYVYKFVSADEYREGDREHNLDLLDEGTLYVARFKGDGFDDDEFDGTGEWVPLLYGEGPLTEDNGFSNQGDVLIKARIAADLLGATKMDRPEDIQPHPTLDGTIYIALTNNTARATLNDQGLANPGINEANPRPQNEAGHVIELVEDDEDPSATSFHWRIFLLCGNPDDPTTYFAGYDKDQVSPIGAPDNLTFDSSGNLLVATDGQPDAIGVNDAFHMVAVTGDQRGDVMQLLSVPVGAEACGPQFTPDDRSLFLAVQHPGQGGSITDGLISNWPDRNDGPVPKPAMVTVYKEDGGRVGS